MAGKVFFSVSMSLEAFIESLEDLMGQQWMELQQWTFPQRYIVLDRRPGLAATTTEIDRNRDRKQNKSLDSRRSSNHVTRPRPIFLHLTRRLRHR